MVRGHDDRVSAMGKLSGLLHHAALVAEVEARAGLVHQQNGRLLRERAGDEHQLALAAAQVQKAAPGQMGNAQLLQLFHRRPALPGPRRGEQPRLPGRAHEHHVERRIVERRALALRNPCDLPRQLAHGAAPDLPPVDPEAAGVSGQKPQHAAEKRRLACTVAAQQRRQPALPDGEGEAGEHGRLPIGKRQLAYLDHSAASLRVIR